MADARTRIGLSPSEKGQRSSSVVETRGLETIVTSKPSITLSFEDFKPDATEVERAEQLERQQRQLAQTLSGLSTNPMISGVYFKDVTFVAATGKRLEHRLKTTPEFLILSPNAAATFHYSSRNSYDITLVASANCVASVWFFASPGGQ